MDFIPAKESKFLLWFFDWYTRILLWRRFRNIIILQKYAPKKGTKTVYFLNHNYWWDGLIPLYLTRKHFNQKARALMEDKQMKQYPFFSKIGAFSINLDNARSTITSLRYAVQSMERDDACLFIYPEGKITSVSDSKPEFKDGITWLYENLANIDFVPVGIYIDYSQANKPDLHLSIGERVTNLDSSNKTMVKKELEKKVHVLLHEIKATIVLN